MLGFPQLRFDLENVGRLEAASHLTERATALARGHGLFVELNADEAHGFEA